MNKLFSTLAVMLCLTAVKAVELNCTFDKKLPAGASISGTVQQENGTSVMVNDKTYFVGILAFDGEEGAGGTLEFDISTSGEPASKLGVILYQKENGKLKRLATPAWMRNIPKDKYTKMTFNFKPGTFKANQKYEIYFYRSNQKGAMKLKQVLFKTVTAAK